jgi:hypothetical protein
MIVLVTESFNIAKGNIAAGKVIEIPDNMFTRLRGKVSAIPSEPATNTKVICRNPYPQFFSESRKLHLNYDFKPFPSDWLNRFNEQELERLALMTIDGGLSDEDAIRALGQVQNVRTMTSIEGITPVAIVEHEPNVHASWPSDVQSIANWFLELESPTESFCLGAHMTVTDPEKFFATLRQEIKTGPSCPRGRMGTLQSDLRKLKEYFN